MNAVGALLAHIDRLRAMHRGNVTPTNGDVDQLFALSDDAKAELATAARGASPDQASAWPAPPTVVLVVEVSDVAGQVTRRIPIGGDSRG